jgi:hypothetical protein
MTTYSVTGHHKRPAVVDGQVRYVRRITLRLPNGLTSWVDVELDDEDETVREKLEDEASRLVRYAGDTE